MDWLKAKYYERKIKKILCKRMREKVYINFTYSVLVARGFTQYFVSPNTLNRVTIEYRYGYADIAPYESKTFGNIKEAYWYFK